jgi:GPH family glycoside/pentoside/hexuronide:cation symporter
MLAPPPAVPLSDKVPLRDKLIYGAAGITDMWSAFTMIRLQVPIFTVVLGLSPTLVGFIMVIFRIWDGFSDPVFGWLSDNTRTRWGRRRPFILIGGVFIGITLPLVYFVRVDWSQPVMVTWIIATGLLLFTAHSCWNVPYQSLMLEMTPDSRERTSLSAVRSYFQQASSIVHGMLWFFITLPIFAKASGELDTMFGTRVIITLMALFSMAVGILPALFLRERYYKVAARQERVSIWANFRHTLKNRPFLQVASFALLYIVGANFAYGIFSFARFYFVTGGDEVLTATITGVDGVIATIAALLGVPCAQWVGNRFGKTVALQAGVAISVVASLLTWFTFTPAAPYLSVICNPMFSFAGAVIWVIIPSMTGDIVEHDELHSGERHEGAFASIFSWIVKMTISIGMVLPGPLMELAGFDAKLGANQTAAALDGMRLILALAPALIMLPALFIFRGYPLSAKRMAEIRCELEARRGSL